MKTAHPPIARYTRPTTSVSGFSIAAGTCVRVHGPLVRSMRPVDPDA